MIGRHGKLFLLFYMIFLLVLFLMCSTDLIIREPEREVYQVAVIIEDTRDDYYSNFRKGIDQAAVELNADVRFITLYEKLDADEQMEFISREQQDGADALVVVPVDENKVASTLAEKQITIPVVLLGPDLMGEAITGNIVIDYKKMGEHLARQMLQRVPVDCPVLFFSEEENQSAMSFQFLEGAKETLKESGRKSQIVVKDTEQGFRETLEALGEGGGQAVILAESPETLTETAGILAENPSLSDGVVGLYGRGSTLPILNYLERDLITGICVTDEFSIGYFSVQMAIQELEKLESRMTMTMDFHYIEKENLRESPYEEMLFPVE